MQVPFCKVYNSLGASHHVRVMFFDNLKKCVEQAGLSITKLSYMAEIPSGHIYSWGTGKRSPSDNDLLKLSSVDELGVSLDVLQAWRILGEYPEKAVMIAAEELRKAKKE